MSSQELRERAVERAWNWLLDKDDRTSPEEYPDMALITREELAECMDDAVLALGMVGCGEWRPIETAPRDGTRVMVWPDKSYNSPGFAVARWGSGTFGGAPGERRHLTGWILDGGFFAGPQPTHWMPLPSPPLSAAPPLSEQEGGAP